jgi:cysteine desulfurase
LSDFAELASLRDAIDKSIKTIEPNAMVLGVDVERLPNTTCLTMPGTDSDTQVMSFDLAGVGISAGSACSSGKAKASGVLKAMKVSDENARSAIRVSLGWSSEETDVEAFVVAWQDLYWRTPARKINLSAA